MATCLERTATETQWTRSDSPDEHFCQPCSDEGLQLGAYGYCVDCQERLCQRCFECHRIPSAFKKHTLLGKGQLLKEKIIPARKDKCTFKCQKHKNKTINYHCTTHFYMGCSVCITLEHRACEGVVYIPEVSKTIKNLKEYKDFSTKLADITSKSSLLTEKYEGMDDAVQKSYQQAVRAITSFKQKRIEETEKLAQTLMQEAKKRKEVEASKVKAVKDHQEITVKDAKNLSEMIKRLENVGKFCDLYVKMMRSIALLESLDGRLVQALETSFAVEPFKIEPCLSSILETSPGRTASDKRRIRKGNVRHLQDINVRRKSDKYPCRISCSVILPGDMLVLVDNNNNCLKLVDTKTYAMVQTSAFLSRPWGVAKAKDNELVVTCPRTSQLIFIDLPCMFIKQEINVEGQCRGLAYCDDKLFVSFNEQHSVKMMDLQGHVLRTIQISGNGKQLFKFPTQLSSNPDKKLLYVSSCGKHSVVCMKFDGTVVATYTDDKLSGPWQTTVCTDGTLFICGHASNNIHLVSADCRKLDVILTEADGLKSPQSISYDETTGTLFIGVYNDNIYKVYKVT